MHGETVKFVIFLLA